MPMLAALRRHLDGSSPYAPRLFTYAANESFTPSAGAASSPFNVYVQRLGQCAVEAGGLRLRCRWRVGPRGQGEPSSGARASAVGWERARVEGSY